MQVIFEQRPELLKLMKEIPDVERAARLDMGFVESSLQQLELGLKKVQTIVEQARKRNQDAGPMGDRDPMPDILSEFVQEAEPKIKELQVLLRPYYSYAHVDYRLQHFSRSRTRVCVSFVSSYHQEKLKNGKQRFRDLAVFFGEPEKSLDKIKPETLFADISKFARETEATRKDRQEKEERDRKRKAAKQKAPTQEPKAAKAAIKKSVQEKPAETPVAQPKIDITQALPELKSSAALSTKVTHETALGVVSLLSSVANAHTSHILALTVTTPCCRRVSLRTLLIPLYCLLRHKKLKF